MSKIIKYEQKNWGNIKKKLSRIVTISSRYRMLSQYNKIPKEKQYWTMGGQCVSHSKIIPGCELDQLVKDKFLIKKQFYSVELNTKICKENQKIKGPTWLNGDFFSVIEDFASNNLLNPAIINYDSCITPKHAGAYVGKILLLLSAYDFTDVLVSCNTVASCSYIKDIDLTEVSSIITSNTKVQLALCQGWEVTDTFIYTAHQTKMVTVSFFRRS